MSWRNFDLRQGFSIQAFNGARTFFRCRLDLNTSVMVFVEFLFVVIKKVRQFSPRPAVR